MNFADDLPVSLYNDLLFHFGSIARARKKAGVHAPVPVAGGRWTLQRMIAELRRLHDNGVPITRPHLERKRALFGLMGAVQRYAGGLVRARQLAGIPPQPRRKVRASRKQRWSGNDVLVAIKHRRALGLTLAHGKVPLSLINAACKHLGSWREAVSAAGIDYAKIRKVRHRYTAQEVLMLLPRLARERPRMTVSQLRETGLGKACLRFFGTIESAAKRARLVSWPIRKLHPVMTKDQVKRALRARKRAGKSMSHDAIADDDIRLLLAIRRHYRGLGAAAHDAGVPSAAPRIKWSRDEVVRQLRLRRARRLSTQQSVVQREHEMLYRSARAFFGSYRAAARKARVPV